MPEPDRVAPRRPRPARCATFSRSAAAAETLALRARGATVRTIGPDARAAEAMGVNLMDRGRVPQVLAAGYAQGKALAA